MDDGILTSKIRPPPRMMNDDNDYAAHFTIGNLIRQSTFPRRGSSCKARE